LEIENKLREFGNKIKLSVYELDLLFWSKETGKVFK
jgi:thermostable 8-oxoguanine DNA glycosylase